MLRKILQKPAKYTKRTASPMLALSKNNSIEKLRRKESAKLTNKSSIHSKSSRVIEPLKRYEVIDNLIKAEKKSLKRETTSTLLRMSVRENKSRVPLIPSFYAKKKPPEVEPEKDYVALKNKQRKVFNAVSFLTRMNISSNDPYHLKDFVRKLDKIYQ